MHTLRAVASWHFPWDYCNTVLEYLWLCCTVVYSSFPVSLHNGPPVEQLCTACIKTTRCRLAWNLLCFRFWCSFLKAWILDILSKLLALVPSTPTCCLPSTSAFGHTAPHGSPHILEVLAYCAPECGRNLLQPKADGRVRGPTPSLLFPTIWHSHVVLAAGVPGNRSGHDAGSVLRPDTPSLLGQEVAEASLSYILWCGGIWPHPHLSLDLAQWGFQLRHSPGICSQSADNVCTCCSCYHLLHVQSSRALFSRSAELLGLQPSGLAHIGGAHILLVASVCTFHNQLSPRSPLLRIPSSFLELQDRGTPLRTAVYDLNWSESLNTFSVYKIWLQGVWI